MLGTTTTFRERLLDAVFLVGVLFTGIDGVLEVVGGALVLLGPDRLRRVAETITAPELAEDPNDWLANFALRSVAHLQWRSLGFLAAYLLLHGVVKVAIVTALLVGSRRVCPWAMGALSVFLVIQVYELVTRPTATVALLALFDAVIIWLTWREWRRDRPLRHTARSTLDWVLRRG